MGSQREARWYDPQALAAAVAAAQQRVGHTVDGKYRITALLGVGGMGVVYEAKHLFLDRVVALKVLHPRYEDAHDAARRFLREAQALGKVGHRAIVTVLDGGFLDGTTPYLVMERLVGENLAQRITRRKALRVEQAVIVLREMLKGLAAAHAKGIVHCDLKPENVFLIDKEIVAGNVKILDFGVARMVAGESSSDPDKGLRTYGTPEYMSPEQVTGGDIEPRTDLYGAGIVAYEALAGKAPFAFDVKARATVFMRILRDTPPSPVGLREPIPAPLVALIAQMMGKTPEERPASALDALRMLDEMQLVQTTSLASIRIVAKR
jgi:serine/threonine-protein kinase